MVNIFWLVGICMAIIVGLLAVATFVAVREVRAVRHWPATTGRVVFAQVKKREEHGPRGSSSIINWRLA